MHRIEGENIDTTEGKNLFKSEAPYTTQTPEWTNAVQEEIMNIIDTAGLETLFSDNDTRDQLLTALQRIFQAHAENTKEIDDEDYTLQDNDVYDLYTFDNLTGDVDFYLATLADYNGKGFYIVNLDGGFDIVINPEGAELINDWNYQFNITEKYGIVKVTKLSDRWLILPLNDASIYYIESEAADTGLSVDGTWDDVDGMELLNGVYGKFLLDAFGNQYCRILSHPTIIGIDFGLGKTSGNNGPDIKHNRTIQIRTAGQDLEYYLGERHIHNWGYTSDGSTVYMKARIISDELNADNHEMYGDTDCPMFIKARRIA